MNESSIPFFDFDEDTISSLMNTSRVTNRGGTYNTKSTCNTSIKSFGSALKELSIDNKLIPHSDRYSENIGDFCSAFKQRQSIAVLQDIQERTNNKIPIYKQEQSLLKNNLRKSFENSLLFSQLSKRTSGEYFPKQNYSILQPQILKSKMLNPIEEEQPMGEQYRASFSSIDTNPSNRLSYSTDISSQ